MKAKDRLRFGPYVMPRFRLGQSAECEYAGTLRVVAISDAPQQWPLGVVKGHRIPVLCGELVRAVRSESAGDVAAAWGVGSGLVSKWRKALRVMRTKGEHLRRSENIKASDPARARKIAKAKRGKPRPRHVVEALRKSHLGKPLSKALKATLSAAHKARGTRPPWLKPAWSAREDRIVRTKRPAKAAELTGRTLRAVFSRRSQLGINDGRTVQATMRKFTGRVGTDLTAQPVCSGLDKGGIMREADKVRATWGA
jgi:hypothetical protein